MVTTKVFAEKKFTQTRLFFLLHSVCYGLKIKVPMRILCTQFLFSPMVKNLTTLVCISPVYKNLDNGKVTLHACTNSQIAKKVPEDYILFLLYFGFQFLFLPSCLFFFLLMKKMEFLWLWNSSQNLGNP